MASDFNPAENVTSPRRYWSLIAVLLDPKKPNTCVLAIGKWEDKVCFAMRWNGNKKNRIGNPQSRGLATWFMVGDEYSKALMDMVPEDKKALVKALLPGAA